MLSVENVSKTYEHNQVEFLAVNSMNMTVDRGEFIAICGPSGSGKSTLFHMLSGLLTPESGHIYFEGKDIACKDGAEMAKYRNSEIGYILQGQSVLKNFTVIENICLPFYLSNNRSDIYEWALELLQKVGLEQYANSYPDQLSGGQMRRVAIARALINHPKLVIADEPTSNLDRENAIYIMELLKKVSKDGIGVIISTHDDMYKDYADKAIIMNKGTVVSTEYYL